jgi:2'-5' RNA ligase
VTDDGPNTGALIVATPAADDPIHQFVDDSYPHITTLWFGDAAALQAEADVLSGVQQALAEVAGRYTGFEAKVSGVAMLGPDKASVLLIESAELVEIRAELCSYPAIEAAWLMADHQFPWYVCHLTVGYSGKIPENPPETIQFDSLALWMAEEKTPYPLLSLGAPAMTAALIPPVECPEDLPICLQYADAHPDARWYAAKRASAFGMSDRVPATWMADA